MDSEAYYFCKNVYLKCLSRFWIKRLHKTFQSICHKTVSLFRVNNTKHLQNIRTLKNRSLNMIVAILFITSFDNIENCFSSAELKQLSIFISWLTQQILTSCSIDTCNIVKFSLKMYLLKRG